MILPVDARVRATPNFLACLREVQLFMMYQDANSAVSRFRKLQDQLSDARRMLSAIPAGGRAARFLDAREPRGQLLAASARQMAQALGTPELRELVVGQYVLLYAHSKSEVVILALRHERQLTYRLPGSGG